MFLLPYWHNHHFTPQYEYVYDDKGRRIVEHVVHFENMKEEFDALMKEYDIPVKLPTKKVNTRSTQAKLTREDLEDDTIALINDKYKKDFESFGYKMINP